jgi:hypothetical protein
MESYSANLFLTFRYQFPLNFYFIIYLSASVHVQVVTGHYTQKIFHISLFFRNKKMCIVEKQTFGNIESVMQQFVLM